MVSATADQQFADVRRSLFRRGLPACGNGPPDVLPTAGRVI
jgi:hypothetical protein